MSITSVRDWYMQRAERSQPAPSNAASKEGPDPDAGVRETSLLTCDADTREESASAPDAPNRTAALQQQILELEKDNADLRSLLDEARKVSERTQKVEQALQSDNATLRLQLASAEDIIEQLKASVQDLRVGGASDDDTAHAAHSTQHLEQQSPLATIHQAMQMATDTGTTYAHKFFNAVPDEGRDAFLAASKEWSFKAGDKICVQATVGDSMYYLASGKASVIVDGRVIGLVQPGELFGVEPFMCSVRSLVVDDTDPKKDNIMMMLGFVSSDGVQHSYCPDRVATITAVAASHVIEFDVQSFLQAIQDDVSSLAKALRVLNKAYRQSCKNSKPAHRHYRWQQQQQKVCKANCETQAPTACIDFATAQGHGRLEHQLCKHQVTPADSASHASSGTPLSLTVSRGPSGDIFSSEPCANVDFQDFGTVFPIIPGRLSFAVHRTEQETRRDIANFPNIYFFSSNLHESYEAYSYDFGPVNLAAVFEFCQQMQEKLGDPRLAERAVCYYSESCVKLRTNAAFLLGAFLIVCRGMTAEEALRPFEAMGSSAFNPFRDATNVHPPTFFLSLRDCFAGLQRAVSASWFDLKTFDFETYCLVDNPDTYDLSRICTKFIAFRGPDVRDQNLRNPEHYFGLFHKMDVTDIVRLNEPDCYDKFTFEQEGIKVHDLEFQDCTTPSSAIVEEFLKLVDKSKGVVAVHCLAGLGRTGTLISLWIMSRLGWSARECIAWLRIVRPGSVLGAQQQYLEECQHALASGKPLPEPDAKEEASAASVAQSVAQAMYDRRHRHILRCSSSSSAAAGGGSGCAEEEEEEETDAFARRQHHQRHHQPHRHTHRRTPHAHTHASANHVPLHSERSCGSGSSSVCSSSYSASSAISNKGSGCDMFGHQLVRHTSNTSDSSSTWSADGFHEFHRDVFQHRHDSSELQFFPDEDDDLGSDQDGVAELMLSMDWSPNNQNSASDIRV